MTFGKIGALIGAAVGGVVVGVIGDRMIKKRKDPIGTKVETLLDEAADLVKAHKAKVEADTKKSKKKAEADPKAAAA